jgi:tripartite-type tricarboxylate transporter receptor subunit TctC
MTFRQRIRLAGAIVALVIFPFADNTSAQDWPARNVTVVVPLAAGSASDIMARVVMDQVGRQLGKTFIIENRPGAGGTVGANMVANAPPDGHTILAYGALGTAHALYTKLPYDTLTAFAPVIPFGQQPLAGSPRRPRASAAGDRRRHGKAKPGG